MGTFAHSIFLTLLVITCGYPPAVVSAQSFRERVQPLIDSSCIDCHDGSEENGLDLTTLQDDLADDATFRKWQRVFDRVTAGEMPPESESRPDKKLIEEATDSIQSSLTAENLRFQKENGRVILRRLTRTEYEHTLRDLLMIDEELAGLIPAENSSNNFDTVFSAQGFSAQHVRSYLEAADKALNAAIQLQEKPKSEKRRFEYTEHRLVRDHIDKGDKDKDQRVVIKELDDAMVMFHTASYLFKLDHHLENSGRYILRAAAYPYQTERPIVLTINAGNYNRGFTEVLGFYDLKPDETREVKVEVYLQKGQYIYPGVEDFDVQPDGKTVWNIGPDDFKGSGIAIKWLELDGPMVDQWPPESTTNLLKDVELKELKDSKWDPNRQTHIKFEITPGDDPANQIETIVTWLAPRAFRRPLVPGEADPFVRLGVAALENGQPFDEAIRTSCRALLVSPQFLFMTSEPGPLDEFSLASRLSYFLWKSMPDNKLFLRARDKQLTDPKILADEVERLLDDPKADRFVKDFTDQWLQLSEIDATAPDERLYPEFDDLLKISMLEETKQFVGHLIENDLGVANLIDSEFAFLNRRLAEHYGIKDVEGQELTKVKLKPNDMRGGVLTHASVMKVTANGTTTSPVRRGSFVLTHLLGTPPNPPPPTIGSIEPDTRGTTTIREMLDKHRSDASCASCHKLIDPPGFALESYDVIGGFRDRFRSREEGDIPETKIQGRKIWEYKVGPPVDASGKLPSGETFADIRQYKKLLMNRKEQIARNLISQLIVYATGAEIQFSDRDEVERILSVCQKSDYGLRTMIHEIVQSRLFLDK